MSIREQVKQLSGLVSQGYRTYPTLSLTEKRHMLYELGAYVSGILVAGKSPDALLKTNPKTKLFLCNAMLLHLLFTPKGKYLVSSQKVSIDQIVNDYMYSTIPIGRDPIKCRLPDIVNLLEKSILTLRVKSNMHEAHVIVGGSAEESDVDILGRFRMLTDDESDANVFELNAETDADILGRFHMDTDTDESDLDNEPESTNDILVRAQALLDTLQPAHTRVPLKGTWPQVCNSPSNYISGQVWNRASSADMDLITIRLGGTTECYDANDIRNWMTLDHVIVYTFGADSRSQGLAVRVWPFNVLVEMYTLIRWLNSSQREFELSPSSDTSSSEVIYYIAPDY